MEEGGREGWALWLKSIMSSFSACVCIEQEIAVIAEAAGLLIGYET